MELRLEAVFLNFQIDGLGEAMQINCKVNGLDELRLHINGLGRKVATVTVAALNDAAYLGMRKTSEALGQAFDRPTPWVKGSVRYVKATKEDPTASVDFDKWGNKTGVTVEKVLQAEIFGGSRKLKRHEMALQRVGILPAGMAIVPGPGAKMDMYGNMSSAQIVQIVQIVSWFQGFEQVAGARQNMRDKGKRLGKDNKKTGAKGFAYFVLHRTTGKLRPGIYQRFTFGHGSAVKAVMYFVKIPSYRQRLDFYGIAEKTIQAEFSRSFNRYVKQILSERGL